MAKQQQARTLETAFNTYTLERVIGEGGAGRVWQAVDSCSTKVAIKILNPDRATTERRKRFQNDIQFCQANNQPNIVRVIDYGVDESTGTPTPFYELRMLFMPRQNKKSGVGASIIALTSLHSA